MELYRYFSSHVFQTLNENQLMLAKPSTLNDPFEACFNYKNKPTESTFRKILRKQLTTYASYLEHKKQFPNEIKNKNDYKEHCRNNLEAYAKSYYEEYLKNPNAEVIRFKEIQDWTLRVSCFTATSTKPEKEVLMWSHYANKHQGFRIKFELPENNGKFFIKKINYKERKTEIDSLAQLDIVTKNTHMKILTTKSSIWEYENEYRMFFPYTLDGHYIVKKGVDDKFRSYCPIESNQVLAVDFGLNCKESEISKIVNLIKNRKDYNHVKLRRAAYHPTDYALQYEAIRV